MTRNLRTILKKSLLGVAASLALTSAQAQFRYTFKDTTSPYVALTSDTSVNGSTIWDEDKFNVRIPFSWKMDSVNTLTTVPLDLEFPYTGIFLNPASTAKTGFLFGLVDLADRAVNAAATTPLSPISHVTTGTAPNRIFKLQFSNAGFYDDAAGADFINFQTWIYETSNIVEFHFGTSSFSPGADYFLTGDILMGFARGLDLMSGAGNAYFIDGSRTPNTIDSLTSTGTPSLLPAWPASGKVYRFSPRPVTVPCAKPTATFTASAQSALTATFTFTAPVTGLDSLVWDFGDNQKQKVTTGFSTPITHTYGVAGRYNASVTAYNSCGSTVATASQVNVAVTAIAGLPNVKVYPTIVDNALFIEGLSAGSQIAIYNAAGQQVHQSVAASSTQAISFTSLPSGMYVIRMTDLAGAQGSIHITRR